MTAMMALARIRTSSEHLCASLHSSPSSSLRLLFSLARVQGFGEVDGQVRPLRLFSSSILPSNQAAPQPECSRSLHHGLKLGAAVAPLSFVSSPSLWRPSTAAAGLHVRSFAAAPVKQEEYNEIVEDINSKFADAREEIELAAESKETVYFNDEVENAKTAVNVVLGLYNGLLARLPDSERGALQRSMGLKMEQLKAELAQLNE